MLASVSPPRRRLLRAPPRRRLLLLLLPLLSLLLLAVFSLLVRPPKRHPPSLFSRSLSPPRCRDVRWADDQCAFVRRYCGDDDAGLLPYLDLYYCPRRLPQPLIFLLFLLWLSLLFATIGIAASDFFSINLASIAYSLGLSESLAGVTFLAFGNGSPDVFGTLAAMGSNSPGMAIGELIGAAAFITGVVAGSMSLVREITVDRKTYIRDIAFFIVAVALTMTFLADGYLQFWECWVMIAYYLLYVLTVVSWHWYSSRRKHSSCPSPDPGPIEASDGHQAPLEAYRDHPDGSDSEPVRLTVPAAAPLASSSSPLLSDTHPESLPGPDRGLVVATTDPDNNQASSCAMPSHDRIAAAEVARSMRLLRTGPRRNHDLSQIRPSLVGALELRSALAHLERECQSPLSPAHLDLEGDYFDTRSRRGTTSLVPDHAQHVPRLGLLPTTQPSNLCKRDRALSSGDLPALAGSRPPRPTLNPLYTIGESLEPARGGPIPSPATDGPTDETENRTLALSPALQAQSSARHRASSGTSSPSTPFPGYREWISTTSSPRLEAADCLAVPEPRRPGCRFPCIECQTEPPRRRHVIWWPHAILPPPRVLLATLFPTLRGWREKSYGDKFFSVIMTPSVFLLVITLPVVDTDANAGTSDSNGDPGRPEEAVPGLGDGTEAEPEWASGPDGQPGSVPVPVPAVETTQLERSLSPAAKAAESTPPSVPPSVCNANDESAPWNRWLVCLQLFAGPLFVVLIIWANFVDDWQEPGEMLVRMVLYTLLISLVLLAVLVLATTVHERPRFYHLLCFLGFVISIAWISTIAGEVVGVLKAIGAILGISEALLGLTVFAAGNSLGDLVADITVARLGYPVMALSACFGGPLLNILLGIGIGGVVAMTEKANHGRGTTPGQQPSYGPYNVQLDGTLLVSSITLLLILVLLLTLVPLNRWVLSRRIGWGLIGLWTASTAINVAIEVAGKGGGAAAAA